MFTGIIEETGTIQKVLKGVTSSSITIQCNIILSDLRVGDSVAVNGVCLTVAKCSGNTFMADIMHETLRRASIGELGAGSRVNLERAMAANGRFGGHIVSGHIDGTGVITRIKKDDNAIWYTIKTDDKIMKYIVEKGSITIDGISLTVAEVVTDRFHVSIIPHTAKITTLSEKVVGDKVNLENDLIGKYIEKFMSYERTQEPQSKITQRLLAKYGYKEDDYVQI